MIVAKRSLVFSILLLGILSVGEVASTKKGKGRRFQQRPLVPAYHNAAFRVPQQQIPLYQPLPNAYPTPPALRQSAVRPVAPRPGIVVFGVGPHSLQIPNHYTNHGGVAQQTNRNVPRPAHYAPPATVITKTATRIQPPVQIYTQPAPYQQSNEQTKYLSKPIQPVYPVQSSQYGNKLPVAQPEKYQQPIAPAVAAPAPVTYTKLPERPTYVAPAKSTVYASAYVAHGPSYPASDSYTKAEASKPVGPIPAPYQPPTKQPQESYRNTATTLYSSKTTESYKEAKAEQSTQAYTKQTTQVKENQSYDYTSSPKVEYFTDVPYSALEYKPTSVFYGTPSNPETPNADKHQSKNPVYLASQSYKEAESLPYGEKKEVDSTTFPYSKMEANQASQSSKQNTYAAKTQEQSKVKTTVYPVSQSYKKVESQEEKKDQVPVYVPNLPPSKSDSVNVGEPYQVHPQLEKSSANQYKQQTPVYPTTQSYKEVDSKSYDDEKKNVDASSYPYSEVQAQPITESSRQNAYQLSTETKKEVALYPASEDYKEVDSSKDISDYKKQDAVIYEPTYVGDSYEKNSDVQPYVKDSQPKQPQENYKTTPSTLYSSKTTEDYKKAKAEQSTETYVKQTTQFKESQPNYSTSSPKVKYVTDVPYITTESKPASVSYGTPSHETPNANKHQSKNPVYPASQSYKEPEALSYGEKKEVASSTLVYPKVEVKPASQQSSKHDAYKGSPDEESKGQTTVYPASQSHEKVESQEKEEVSVYVSNHPFSKTESINVAKSYQANPQPEKSYTNQYKQQTPFYSTTQSYKEVSSISYGEKNKDVYSSSLPYSKGEANPASQPSVQHGYKGLAQEESKVKGPVYPEPHSYKKLESSEEKKKQVPVYIPNRPPAKAEPATVGELYQSSVQQEKSYVEKSKQQTPVYLTTQSYKEVGSHAYAGEKKNVDAPRHPVSDKDSYLAPDSHTRAEASKPVGSIPAPYQSPAKQTQQETYRTTPSTLYSSKTTESYKQTKAEQSTYAYTKPPTQVKENLSYDSSTPSPKVKYSTDAPYSAPEYKPTSVSYGTPSNPETPNADKHQSKNPVYPASQSYKEAESLPYGEKKEGDSTTFPYSKVEANPVSQSSKQNTYAETTQEETKAKTSEYPASQSYKNVESDVEKKDQVPVYVPNSPPSKFQPINVGGSYYHQAHPQLEKSSANQYKQQTPAVSPATQSYKEVDSESYGEKKKNVDASSYPYSKLEAKPTTESSKQNTYQTTTEGKKEVAAYPASQDYYKEAESPKDAHYYKKQNPAVYESTAASDAYVKNSNVQSYEKESQPKVVPTSDSYEQFESLPKSEPVPYKTATVLTNQKYSSNSEVTQESLKYHVTNSESTYSSVSPVPKSPVKELNSYSKATSVESSGYSLPVYSTTISSPSYQYSTGYKTTSERSTTPAQDNSKVYYNTTPKYQEYSSSLSVAVRDHQEYRSTTAANYIPVVTTPSEKQGDYNQYSTKKYVEIKADATIEVKEPYASQTTTKNYDVNANDRVYVVADQDETVESYKKKEPSVAYQSYKNPSAEEKLSTVKQGVNQYASTDRDYSGAPVGTTSNSNYNRRPSASPATDLPKYNGKPIPEADSYTTSRDITKHSDIYRNDGVAGDYSAIPGKPEVDYPIFSELPNDKFNCSEQRLPGYYADTSARCQVFHICLGDRQWSFLCPNGTIFSQQHFVCVWWYEFDCAKATSLYDLNEKLFIIPSKQEDSDHKGDQYAKAQASKTLEETGKQYETFRNKAETTSGAY